MKKKTHDSIVFKLIGAISIIFIIMLVVSMVLINRKQTMIMDTFVEEYYDKIPQDKGSVVFFIDSSKVQSNTDFSLYLFFVMSTVIILGSLSFALIIRKILKPLKKLQKKIGQVDIDKPESFENIVVVDNTSSEIVELSESFDRMLKKIYADYRRQKDFSSNVAHELRTPIAVMRSQLDLFKQKTHSQEAEDMIKVLDRNVNKLNSLVDAILSLRKQAELKPSSLSLDSLIDEIVFDLEDKAAAKNVEIIDNESQINLISDDNLLQRLIYNIVDNAIKYNIDGGRVEISAKTDGDFTKISIADTGLGLKAEDKDRIFDLFYQVDSSRGVEGFGIGLSLSKTIAQMLGAEIEILENKPRGTIFIVKIPNTLS